MTISSILLHWTLKKWYNDVGEIMDKIQLIYNFEKNLLNNIIDKLDKMGFTDFTCLIKSNSQKILTSETLKINEEFDFEIHFEVMSNYINNYDDQLINSNKLIFIEIVQNDFILYWKNIKNPKLEY